MPYPSQIFYSVVNRAIRSVTRPASISYKLKKAPPSRATPFSHNFKGTYAVP